MAVYQGNCTNNFSNLKMDATDNTIVCLEPSNASPPDFDFNLPCRFFKSSFARSLSLNNASNQSKSLDYDMRSNINNNSNSNNKLPFIKRDTKVVPPIPQRRNSQAGSFYTKPANEANRIEYAIIEAKDQPPALPARRPLSLHNLTLGQNFSVSSGNNEECQMNVEQQKPQPQQQQYTKDDDTLLTPLHTNNSNNNHNNNNNSSNNNKQNNTNHVTGLQAQNNNHHQYHEHQKHQLQCINASNGVCCNKNINNNSNNSIINGCSGTCNGNNNKNNNNSVNNFRRNNIVWPHQQENVEQNCNLFDTNHNNEDVNNSVNLNSNYQDTTKLSSITDYSNHFNNSQQMIMNKIPTINIHINQQQQQQQRQQQQQQQHQLSSYNEILNDNNTNVEAVILQNQVDTLQWQLKQVETSCDMYRAVMEEVARFLERYQTQKQLQQQQQQQQQQQTVATNKHNNSNNNNKMEQIKRSKSLFQVYIAGGHDKSSNDVGSNTMDETTSTSSSSMSYLRARSSTNLIDIKHQQNAAKTTSTCNKKLIGHSKDDHNYETELTPTQSSYSAFKDFTWRRSPKNADSRLNIAKDMEEEKLNQEAFRLLRTIQNLLNTSQHQPDLAHQRHSLTSSTAMHMGRLAKAISTTSVMTLPGAPLLNSTSLTIGANSAGSSTPDSTTAPPLTTATANNAASNNLAPEMLFLRTTNIRDSRLSLRSSTDSSVHSTSSAASSASSKVETDEEATTTFRTPANVLNHKQHHHLTGSSTEDESGFSSISSFADIGVPLSSSLLSSTSSVSNNDRMTSKELKSSINDSRNSTLKANTVGLPLNSLPDMSHRWDSPSKTYHNASNKFQRFSALSNEDANTVLWV